MSTAPKLCAWRFVLPWGLPASESGLRLGATGSIETVTDDAAVRQAILLLLSTRPGERVMRPHYGCDLRRLVFADNDATTAGLAIHYVREAVRRWEPRVEVLRLDANPSRDVDGRLDIDLEYRVRSTRSIDQLTFALDLNGESNA